MSAAQTGGSPPHKTTAGAVRSTAAGPSGSLLLPLHLLPQKPQLFLSVCLLVHTPGLPHWSGLLAGQVQPPTPLHRVPLRKRAGRSVGGQ